MNSISTAVPSLVPPRAGECPPDPLDPPVNRSRLIDTFVKLVKTRGESFNERAVAEFIKKEAATLGASSVVEDKAGDAIGGNTGNLIINIPGNTPGAIPLIFSSHMDTVDLAIGAEPRLENGVFRSNGETALGGDDRAGISEILEAVREVKEANLPHGDIQLVFTVAEEGGLLGSRQLDRNMLKGELAFVMDVFKPNQIYMQGEHLLAVPPEAITAETVHKAHQQMAEGGGITPPPGLNLTPQEQRILDFTAAAMGKIGLTPEFRRLEWAGTDAISLRRKGINAISLGAGESRPHSTQETVAVEDLVNATRLVRSLISLAAAPPMVAQTLAQVSS